MVPSGRYTAFKSRANRKSTYLINQMRDPRGSLVGMELIPTWLGFSFEWGRPRPAAAAAPCCDGDDGGDVGASASAARRFVPTRSRRRAAARAALVSSVAPWLLCTVWGSLGALRRRRCRSLMAD